MLIGEVLCRRYGAVMPLSDIAVQDLCISTTQRLRAHTLAPKSAMPTCLRVPRCPGLKAILTRAIMPENNNGSTLKHLQTLRTHVGAAMGGMFGNNQDAWTGFEHMLRFCHPDLSLRGVHLSHLSLLHISRLCEGNMRKAFSTSNNCSSSRVTCKRLHVLEHLRAAPFLRHSTWVSDLVPSLALRRCFSAGNRQVQGILGLTCS